MLASGISNKKMCNKGFAFLSITIDDSYNNIDQNIGANKWMNAARYK